MPVDLWLGRGGCEDIWYLRRTESSFISKEVLFRPPYRWDPMVWQSIASLCCLMPSQFFSLFFWAKNLNIYVYIYVYIHTHTYTHIYSIYTHVCDMFKYIYIYIRIYTASFFNIIIFPSLLLFLSSSVSEAKDLQELISWDICWLQPLQGSE